MTNRALQHVSRRKYINTSLRFYGQKPNIDVRRLRRILGSAYDDMCAGKLNLF